MLSKSAYSKLSPSDKKKVKAMASRRPARKLLGQVRIRGKGDYWTGPGSKRSDSMFDSAGAKVGGVFGPLGRVVGGGLHGLFKKITGFGDYKVNSNSLTGNGVPKFGSMDRQTVVRHREYLGDVLSSIAFNVTTYPINAGMVQTMPWLSQVANSYEQHQIRGMVFQYRSTSATSLTTGTTTGMGSVMMATKYDSVASDFTSESQMLNHEYSTSTVPSRDQMHPIECARGETPVATLYTRNAAPPSNADLRLYDLGQFSIATVGQSSDGDILGQLWCTYEIVLLKPQLGQVGEVTPVQDHYAITAPTSTAYFGASDPVKNSGTVGTTCVANATFPLGLLTFPTLPVITQYEVFYSCSGNSTLLTTALTASLSAGLTAALYYNNGAASQRLVSAGATASTQMFVGAYVVPANTSCNMNFATGSTLPGGVAYADLIVSQLPFPSTLESKISQQLEFKEIKEIELEVDSEDDDELLLELLRKKAAKKRVKEESKELRPDIITEEPVFVKREPSTPTKMPSRK